jgi:prolyl 4-hydroxylase
MIKDVTKAQVDALLAQKRYQDAAQLLLASAAVGNPQACGTLAEWRITGDIIRRDLGVARTLLGKAAAGGHREAALLHASFLASGVGGPDEWPRARAALKALAAAEPRARHSFVS